MQAVTTATYGIGRLAELSGVSVKTIRFYSDAGVLPPSMRTAAGHRRYTQADLARLQLVRTLRDLALDLPTIQRVVEGRHDLASVLAVHVAALEARIRGLRRQLAVARAAAGGASSEVTLRRVHALASLESAERTHLLDRFWDRVLADAPADPATARRFREAGSPTLPDEPTAQQIDAWIELTELAADQDFQRQIQANATWSRELTPTRSDPRALAAALAEAMSRAETAISDGLGPDDQRADAIIADLARIWAAAVGQQDSPAFRGWLVGEIERHTDPRAARYWRLVSVLRDGSSAEITQGENFVRRAAAFEWLVRALGRPSPGV